MNNVDVWEGKYIDKNWRYLRDVIFLKNYWLIISKLNSMLRIFLLFLCEKFWVKII